MFVDGMDQCVLIDQRTYPQRTTSEPDQDKSFRGSRDGFVETMVFNAALIRRRIRSPRLCRGAPGGGGDLQDRRGGVLF